ncbi:alpha/beta hydrolase [Simiduia sp. 21SJ11W-1]|uniref:alpha/beta hydrolase n=1 Tax=Simiduia sp. 21SJ11W-1 TaxID=2909669 RepID=UPI00209DC238|nr:alpha/beta hydrolase [Simiduia sp. 21SJ11W-1]UTA49338.1 alpha/beta hydrolase [Simiduia sp. 21SJ11W-1]
MKHCCFLGAVLCAWLMPGFAETPVQPVSFTAIAGNVPYSAIANLPFNEPDLRIAYGHEQSQYGLLWRARGERATSQRPLVVFIHGGCWLSAYDIKHSNALSSALADVGFAVWSLEYRRTGASGGGWPATLNDIRQALGAIEKLAIANLDFDGLVLVGHSAGGHLALLADGDAVNTSATAGSALTVRALVGLAAIVDLERYGQGGNSCQSAVSKFMGGDLSTRPAEYQSANPAGRRLTVPTFLLHGTDDHIVGPEQARHADARTVLVPSAGHFDWLHPGSEAFGVLVKTLEKISDNEQK